MTYPFPALEPPFEPELASAADTDFPIRLTKRAKQKLFGFLVNHQPYYGPCLKFFFDDNLNYPQYRICDRADLDAVPCRITKFGRVTVGAVESDADALAGYRLDCRTFPPGPPNFYLMPGPDGFAMSDTAGRLMLSVPKLIRLHPELFRPASAFTKVARSILSVTSLFAHTEGNPGWMGRLVGEDDPGGQAEAIESIAHRLWAFGTEPAVVLSSSPFVVASFSTEFDHVMLHRLPQELVTTGPNGLDWSPGDRLISCNSYGSIPEAQADISHGPDSTHEYNQCWYVLADFLSDETGKLDTLKAGIPREKWDRTFQLGEERRQNGDPCRDGRPWLARVSVAEQGRGWWRRKGGYLSSRPI